MQMGLSVEAASPYLQVEGLVSRTGQPLSAGTSGLSVEQASQYLQAARLVSTYGQPVSACMRLVGESGQPVAPGWSN